MEAYGTTANEKSDKTHPYRRANFLSKIFFIWLLPLFYKGYKKDLSEEDIFPNLREHDSEVLGNKLEREWEKELNGKKDPALWKALLRVFGSELALMGVWYAFMELFIRLAQPLALSQLLKYYEPDSTMSKNEAYIYSGLIVASATFTMLSQHNFMLYQFNQGVKIRTATSALVYRKALKLSRSSLSETNVGQMVNLISNDVGRFENAVKHIHNLWFAPLEIAIIMILLYFYVGPTGIPGVLFLLIFIPFQMWLGKKTSVYRFNTAVRTDERIRSMNEIISGIQVIKMYTWEKPFAKLVDISRRHEMLQIKNASTIRAAVMSFQLFLNKIAIYLCVLVYVLTGNIISAQYVYVVTSFFFILRTVVTKRFPEGVTQFAEAKISVQRIREFLMRNEIEHDFTSNFYNKQNGKHVDTLENNLQKLNQPVTRSVINLDNVSVKWNNNLDDYSISYVNMDITANELAVIIGPVGSGKTTVLYTILRELPQITGSIEINGQISYASQEPWLFMASIKQNILFGQTYDFEKYREVIKVCALETDLALFPHGDQTLVGERGVILSGGQRARVNLARAIYKDADIYLLDDPLSAVDTHVGKHIFEECIQKYLKNKCVVLVTHQLQYINSVNKIYLMDDGKLEYSGNYEQLQNSGKSFAKLLKELKDEPEIDATEKNQNINTQKTKESNGIFEENIDSKVIPKIVKEGRGTGQIGWNVYQAYFSNGGHWCKVLWIFFVFVLAQFLSSLSDYYLTWWVNAEAIRKASGEVSYTTKNETKESNNTYSEITETNKSSEVDDLAVKTITKFQELWLIYMTKDISLIVYSLVMFILIVLAVCRSLFFFRYCINTSINLHNRMFSKIVYAKMKFFNENPSGRILNRFSKDMNQVDEVLPATMIDTIQNGLTALFTSLVVATVNPWMMIPTVVILFIFYYLRMIYIATSRDVKRIEGTTRSPIYSHLSTSLHGLTTIRAFGAQNILKKEYDQHQNKNSSAFITFIAIGRCFGMWLDAQCCLYIFFVTMSFLFFDFDTLGGFVGLSITQSLSLTGMLQWGIRQWSELENAMTCVERIKEYIDVVPENDTNTKDPPKDWPNEGKITFKDFSLKYSADGPTVLKNLNLSIKNKEKVGIVGRTGAGKSSIINALFRLAENNGIIEIDGINTKIVKLERLRANISIIPQEPVLFSGSLRKNLDPFDEFSDALLWNALEEVELKETVSDLPLGLESKMTEGGKNFSVGQRQLVCLARAIIRRNKILVMDEATANVDPHTDALIQVTIRKKFNDCTVLTIAHRLHTIMDSDKVLVMDAGKAVEFGRPFELLQITDGVFYDMVQQTGQAMANNLTKIAETTFKQVKEP